jgi:hypothetical protein
MTTYKRITLILTLILAALLAAACSIDVSRNPDGSLRVETVMTEEAMQSEIQLALADPLIQELAVDLQNGTILVEGTRKRVDSDETDQIQFHLDLSVVDGHLTAVISQAEIDGHPIEDERLAVWNERIATNLERLAAKRPNSSLLSVEVSDSDVTLVSRIETARSRGE